MKKLLFRLLASVAVLFGALAALAWLTSGKIPDERRTFDAEALKQLDEWRNLEVPGDQPESPFVSVDYPLKPSDPAYPSTQSPILAGLVEEGVLPPVFERTGAQPLVLEGPDGAGHYGGTWLRVQTAGSTNFWRQMASPSLVRGNYLGTGFVPHLARSFEVNADKTVYTFYLREGVRWSDGHPLTSEDFAYWWAHSDREGTGHPALRIGGEMGRLEVVDTFTIQFRFPVPNPTFLIQVAKNDSFALPKHYLHPYDPDQGNPEKIEALMDRSGAISAESLFRMINTPDNPERPQLMPWVARKHAANAPYILVRNPYYWAVDTEGRQLPYLDRVIFSQKEQDYLPLTASQGGVTFQYRKIERDSYSVLMASRERNNYEVYHWIPQNANKFTLYVNLDRHTGEGDPASDAKRKLLLEKRFRQALSLAIDRREIIRSEYNDLVEPAQIVPKENSPFYSETLEKAFIEHEPERAARLLDEIGLTERDSEGFRLLPDGQRLNLYILVNSTQAGWEPINLVIQDWADVGIRATLRLRSPALYGSERSLGQYDLAFFHASAGNPLFDPNFYVPAAGSSSMASSYGIWFQEGGALGYPVEDERAKAPPEGSDLRKAMEYFAQAQITPELEKQKELVGKAFDLAAENIWSISVSKLPSELAVAHEDLRNVPKVAIGSYLFNTPSNVGPETFYLENVEAEPKVAAQIASQLRASPEDPFGGGGVSGEVGGQPLPVGKTLFILLIVGLFLVGLRKPFVLRRFAIMVPTLFVVSIIVFTVIQLPPGSFIETRILILEETGDEAAIEQVKKLRETFWLDEPFWKRYARWAGFYWFVTFDKKDAGLLQGDFGRSMETLSSVNEMVSERMALTMAVSAGTILFTWVVAFPIGIISAVRQYTFVDYFFTVVGFLGMCIPNFLLALLLSYWGSQFFGTDLSGLFSPEYIGQPDWTWGKFLDLLAHIWIPIVVLGTSGTLGMIRVVRNNLLDELKKPYVVTARAKGVRPARLLFKYPVRMALNPFISGIGGIFPALVSGGAIVAIVLSLPTVGPLLLTSLMSEDFYMAGSLLMMLTTLSILGILFSDILLMVVDPRIRMEK